MDFMHYLAPLKIDFIFCITDCLLILVTHFNFHIFSFIFQVFFYLERILKEFIIYVHTYTYLYTKIRFVHYELKLCYICIFLTVFNQAQSIMLTSRLHAQIFKRYKQLYYKTNCKA